MAETTGQVALGRLAFRRQGKWWVCYHAKPNTMNNAIELCRIKVVYAERSKEIKEAFMALGKTILDAAVQATSGTKPTWNEPVPGTGQPEEPSLFGDVVIPEKKH